MEPFSYIKRIGILILLIAGLFFVQICGSTEADIIGEWTVVSVEFENLKNFVKSIAKQHGIPLDLMSVKTIRESINDQFLNTKVIFDNENWVLLDEKWILSESPRTLKWSYDQKKNIISIGENATYLVRSMSPSELVLVLPADKNYPEFSTILHMSK